MTERNMEAGEQATLCIIDDIASVVEGLSQQVKWEEYGIRVAGTALDGEEGLRLIRSEQPDIVLTDIRMPHLDGIEMMNRLSLDGIAPRLIFFSGYTDFEYAQQAVRLGAFDYVTKPHAIREIVDIVCKARDAVLAERREQAMQRETQRKMRESMPVLRQEFIKLLLHHPSSLESVRQRWDFLQIELAQENLAVMVIEIDHYGERSRSMRMEEAELLRFSLQNIVEETIAACTRGMVIRETMSRFAVVYETAATREARLAEQCADHIARYTKFTVSIGLGRVALRIGELAGAYRQAVTALSYQFYTGGNTVLLYDDVAGRGGEAPRYSKEKEQELGMYLRSGNAAGAVTALEHIFEELAASQPLPEPVYLISVYNEIASFVLRVLLENVPYDDMRELDRASLHARLGAPAALKELQRELILLCTQGCSMIDNRRQTESQRSIDEAVRHMRANLREDLTLADCARHVHLSGNYFANVFKKVTGMTFVQFLTQERVEAAKRMLLEGGQVQEIAGEVGYEDRRYFSNVFKKHTGMTPSEFKSRYHP